MPWSAIFALHFDESNLVRKRLSGKRKKTIHKVFTVFYTYMHILIVVGFVHERYSVPQPYGLSFYVN